MIQSVNAGRPPSGSLLDIIPIDGKVYMCPCIWITFCTSCPVNSRMRGCVCGPACDHRRSLSFAVFANCSRKKIVGIMIDRNKDDSVIQWTRASCGGLSAICASMSPCEKCVVPASLEKTMRDNNAQMATKGHNTGMERCLQRACN